MSCSKPSPYFFFPSFWCRYIYISAIQIMLLQKWSGFFRCFWQSLIMRCLHLVVLNKSSLFALMKSSLDCRLWQFLTPISWRVFFNWLDVMKGFFFTMERILRSSTTVVLHGRPGLFMLLSSLVRSLFLRMYQPLDFGHSECSCYLSDRCVLFLKPYNCMSHLYGEIL